MKNQVKILFAATLCVALLQTNVQGQGLKNALNKVKGAVNSVTNKKGGAEAESKTDAPSTGPAKPIAPEVKNSVADLRALTGLTKGAFEAKMKNMGFAEGADDVGMGGICYKSKSAGYTLSVKFGTRGKDFLVREVSKGTMNKTPNIPAIKTKFQDLEKQCTNLKAKFETASIKVKGSKSTNVNNEANRSSKFLPAFDNCMNTNEECSVLEGYTERDYTYNLSYMYSKAGALAVLFITVTDLTIESQEG